MKFNLLLVDTLNRILEAIQTIATDPTSWFGAAVASLGYMLLAPLAIVIYIFHELTLMYLQFTPYPGYSNDGDELHIFTSPEAGTSFASMQDFMSLYIEPLALFFVFFSIIVILFLRVFDVVIDDIGINIEEAKKRLFIAPLLIVLWVPLANALLYFAYGMTEFLNAITFNLPDTIEDPGDINLMSGNEINVLTYIEAIIPDDGNIIDFYLLFTKVFLAYLILIPVIILYGIAAILAIFRVIGVFGFYIIGPIAFTLWAFNWRDLGQLGGTAIRYFVVLSLFPIVVAFINLMAPLLFYILGDVLAQTIATAFEEAVFETVFSSVDFVDGGSIDAESLISVDYALAMVFLFVTPILVGFVPWGIVIGFNKALSYGMKAGGAVLAGTALAAGGAGLLAAKGVGGMANAAVQANDGVEAKSGVSGTLSNAASGLRTGNISDTTSQFASNVGQRVRDDVSTAKTMAGNIASNTSTKDVEEYVAKSGVADKRLGTFGDVMQKGMDADLNRRERFRTFQAMKADGKLERNDTSIIPDSSDLPTDENGEFDWDEATDDDILEYKEIMAERDAVADKIGSDYKSGKLKRELGEAMHRQADGDEYKKLAGLSAEEADEAIPDEFLMDQYFDTLNSEDKELKDIWTESSIDRMNESVQNIDRSDVEDKLMENHNEFFQQNFEEMQQHEDELYEDTNLTRLQDSYEGAIYDGDTSYQDGLDEEFKTHVQNEMMRDESISGAIASEDMSDKERENLVIDMSKEWQKKGGDTEALKAVVNSNDDLFDVDEMDLNIGDLEEAMTDSLSEIGEKLGDEFSNTNSIDSLLNEVEKATKKRGRNTKNKNVRKQEAEKFVDNAMNLSSDISGGADVQAEIAGSVFEEFAEEATKEFENSIGGVKITDSSSEPMVLESEIDIDNMMPKDKIEEQAKAKIEHVAELNGYDLDTEEIEQIQRTAVESSTKVIEDRIQQVSESQIDAMENALDNLDNNSRKNLEKNASERFQQLLGEAHNTGDIYGELQDMSQEEQTATLKEMKKNDLF